MYCATQLCVCSAGFELFELLLFDGLDELELLLFEGLEEGLELLELELFLFELEFEVEAVLFFFDSEVFDLFEESAFAVSSFFLFYFLLIFLFVLCLCRIFRWCQSGSSAIFFRYI